MESDSGRQIPARARKIAIIAGRLLGTVGHSSARVSGQDLGGSGKRGAI